MGDNAMSQDGVNRGRRRFLTAATSVVGAAGAVAAAVPFVGSWNPSARARAAGAPVRADIGRLEPGQMVVVEWRGQAGSPPGRPPARPGPLGPPGGRPGGTRPRRPPPPAD